MNGEIDELMNDWWIGYLINGWMRVGGGVFCGLDLGLFVLFKFFENEVYGLNCFWNCFCILWIIILVKLSFGFCIIWVF